jgi:PhnB protein
MQSKMSVKPIPDGYNTATPYLVLEGASKLIDFLKQAFMATEIYRMTRPDGKVGHAEVKIGDSVIMLGDMGGKWKSMPSSIYLYVPNIDATYRQAVEAGAISLMEPADQFYGDRSAGVRDPFGNHWFIATHIEDVSAEELTRREQAFLKKESES